MKSLTWRPRPGILIQSCWVCIWRVRHRNLVLGLHMVSTHVHPKFQKVKSTTCFWSWGDVIKATHSHCHKSYHRQLEETAQFDPNLVYKQTTDGILQGTFFLEVLDTLQHNMSFCITSGLLSVVCEFTVPWTGCCKLYSKDSWVRGYCVILFWHIGDTYWTNYCLTHI